MLAASYQQASSNVTTSNSQPPTSTAVAVTAPGAQSAENSADPQIISPVSAPVPTARSRKRKTPPTTNEGPSQPPPQPPAQTQQQQVQQQQQQPPPPSAIVQHILPPPHSMIHAMPPHPQHPHAQHPHAQHPHAQHLQPGYPSPYDYTPGGMPPMAGMHHGHEHQSASPPGGGSGRTLSSSKRAEQNRKAQRAFRERRDQYVHLRSMCLYTQLTVERVFAGTLKRWNRAPSSLTPRSRPQTRRIDAGRSVVCSSTNYGSRMPH